MDRLLIGAIHFGELDALNELSSGTDSVELFLSSYSEPRGLDPAAYLAGEKWFIQGRRGTGKTAFLQYLCEKHLNTQDNANSFVAFNELGSTTRNTIILNAQVVDLKKPRVSSDEADVAIAWRIFLHKELARLFERHPTFVSNFESTALPYITASKKFFDSNSGANALTRFFEGLFGGAVSIEIPIPTTKGTLTIDKGKKMHVAVSALADSLDELLQKIEILPGKQFAILVDELNPSTISQQERNKDYVLIRNLVSAVHSFNRLLRRKFGRQVLLVCGVRSEVMERIDFTGSEFNRNMADKGFEITWRKRNPNDSYHDAPLIRLVRNKIQASEKRILGRYRNDTEIWETYFDNRIFGLPPEIYLYQSTWARPRDIIRLFNACRTDGPRIERFREEVFRRVQGQVQAEYWKDRIHELQLVYNEIELGAIERALTSFEREFGIMQFEQQLKSLSQFDGEVGQLLAQRGVQPLLRDLYKAGVVGNKKGNEQHWEYEFTPNPHFSMDFVVHRGLWSHLRLVP
jgi:hypothetical protein